ncbi:MAG: hypothetical protein LBR33_10930 [Propionibacteriaceae bacterium]|jgi:hypothetical protein|nr:hypothetical protein [Propionibacteriaceae bacterium]
MALPRRRTLTIIAVVLAVLVTAELGVVAWLRFGRSETPPSAGASTVTAASPSPSSTPTNPAPPLSAAIDLAQGLTVPSGATASATLVTVEAGVAVAIVRVGSGDTVNDYLRGFDLATGSPLWTVAPDAADATNVTINALANGAGRVAALVQRTMNQNTAAAVTVTVYDLATGAAAAHADFGESTVGQGGPALWAYQDGVVHVSTTELGWVALSDADLTALWSTQGRDFLYSGDIVLGHWVWADVYRDGVTSLAAPFAAERASYQMVGESVVRVDLDDARAAVTLSQADLETGQPVWPTPLALSGGAGWPWVCATAESPLIVVDGETVHALTRSAGTELWSVAAGAPAPLGCAVVAGRYAAVGRSEDSTAGTVEAEILDLHDGSSVATLDHLVDDPVGGHPAWLLTAGTTVFAHTADGQFTAYSGTGAWKTLWSVTLGATATVAYQAGSTFYFLDGAELTSLTA